MQKPPTISPLFWLFPKLAGHYTTQVELIRVEDELNVFQVRARVCVSDCFVDDEVWFSLFYDADVLIEAATE